MQYPSFPCPKCSRLLEPAGVITHADGELPTYQCDHCTHTVEMFGKPMDLPYTFCVGEDGKPFDPAEDID